jgi:hypothetical protein
MKNLITVFFISFLFSCTTAPKKIERKANDIPIDGKFLIENGMGKMDSIAYTLLYTLDSDIRMDTVYFRKIIEKASLTAKYTCKYKPTYEPIRISILPQKGFNPDPVANKDSISTILEFRAKNGFGVPNEHSSYCVFHGGNKIKDF